MANDLQDDNNYCQLVKMMMMMMMIYVIKSGACFREVQVRLCCQSIKSVFIRTIVICFMIIIRTIVISSAQTKPQFISFSPLQILEHGISGTIFGKRVNHGKCDFVAISGNVQQPGHSQIGIREDQRPLSYHDSHAFPLKRSIFYILQAQRNQKNHSQKKYGLSTQYIKSQIQNTFETNTCFTARNIFAKIRTISDSALQI